MQMDTDAIIQIKLHPVGHVNSNQWRHCNHSGLYLNARKMFLKNICHIYEL